MPAKKTKSDKLTLRLKETVNTTSLSAYDAFTRPEHLSKWFTTSAQAELTVGGRYSNADGDKGEFLSLNPPHMVKFTWENEGHCPGTVVEVRFVPIGDNQIEIRLQHSELANEKDVQDMKTGWSWALTSLKSYLETGKPIAFEQWQKANRSAD